MNKIKIEDMYARFDPKSGFIELTTKDARMHKEPFKIVVSGDSPSYNTLLKVIESEIDIQKIDLPDNMIEVDIDALNTAGNDPRIHINTGETTGGEINTWDLSFAPHTLIINDSSFSYISYLKTILTHADTQDNIKLYAADCSGIEINKMDYGSKDTKIAKTTSDILDMVNEISNLITTRYTVLEELGINNFIDSSMKATYLFIDALDYLELNDEQFEHLVSNINNIIKLGRAAGVFMFITFRKIDNLKKYEEIATTSHIGRRVTGKIDSKTFMMLNRVRPKWSGYYLSGRGRAIVTTYNKQELVQGYYVKRQ